MCLLTTILKQEARLEAGELKAELENLKADNARRNFGKQGNSLFGEVQSIFYFFHASPNHQIICTCVHSLYKPDNTFKLV